MSRPKGFIPAPSAKQIQAVNLLRVDPIRSYGSIAAEVGCSAQSIKNWATATNLTRRTPCGRPKGYSPAHRSRSTPLPPKAKKALTTPDTTYYRVSGVMSSDFAYNSESNTLPVDDGIYEVVSGEATNPELYTYWFLSKGKSIPLTNPYATIPTENVETLHDYTQLCYDHLTEEAHRAIHGDI